MKRGGIIGVLAVLGIGAAVLGGRRRGGSGDTYYDFEEEQITGGGGDYVPPDVVGQGPFASYADLPATMNENQQLIRDMAEAVGIDPSWSMFFEATAKNESGFKILAGLGKPELFPPWAKPNTRASKRVQDNEAAAAAKAYERNAGRLSKCGYPKSRYAFGSGGLFAMLPANAILNAFKNTELECMDPWEIFDPVVSFVCAVSFAKGLMNWTGYKKNPVLGNVRVGWGNPSKMGNPESMQKSRTSDRGFGSRLEELGYGRDRWSTPAVSLSGWDPVAAYYYLKQEFA